jgi:hypothetical protein
LTRAALHQPVLRKRRIERGRTVRRGGISARGAPQSAGAGRAAAVQRSEQRRCDRILRLRLGQPRSDGRPVIHVANVGDQALRIEAAFDVAARSR